VWSQATPVRGGVVKLPQAVSSAEVLVDPNVHLKLFAEAQGDVAGFVEAGAVLRTVTVLEGGVHGVHRANGVVTARGFHKG
jgi:hypothetical protein